MVCPVRTAACALARRDIVCFPPQPTEAQLLSWSSQYPYKSMRAGLSAAGPGGKHGFT